VLDMPKLLTPAEIMRLPGQPTEAAGKKTKTTAEAPADPSKP